MLRNEAEPVHLLFNAVLYRDENGKSKGVFAVGRDITERRKLEMQLRQFNEELEAQVRIKTRQLTLKATELEQFAYLASHDLQEPLNTTSGFIRLLKKKYEGKLDKEADVYFSFIAQASDRMKTLIRVLLEYSRLGGKKELAQVDCNALLGEVLADLGDAIHTHQAVVKADALPVLNGYSMEIKLLFQNLLGNAIKFAKKDSIPEIHISAKRGVDHWTFCCKDNGIGIEPAYHDKIFLLFRRLHTRAEYEGTGIGLAHCRKIVELHDGRIWVESEPEAGSSFYFTIHDM
jgi:light-regulated signal transduction histidine kinase (bacteriophytochrome)